MISLTVLVLLAMCGCTTFYFGLVSIISCVNMNISAFLLVKLPLLLPLTPDILCTTDYRGPFTNMVQKKRFPEKGYNRTFN